MGQTVLIKGCSLMQGSAKDLLKSLGDGSVDAVVVDPPYGVEVADWDGRVPYELILDFLRVCKGSVLWFGSAAGAVVDARSFPVAPDRLLIWSPNFTLSKVAKDGFAYRYHPIWAWRLMKQKEVPWDVFSERTECGNWWFHPCTKPVKLISRLVKAVTKKGETVLDPFAGSGTTAVACIKTGRRFIGSEINQEYVKIAERRMRLAILREGFDGR